ncbi:S4 domain-containing protein, partial [Enterococcus faecium]|uniref:S4 domain-containing protein n=1 Tax=Enterococcus faecium TaxID=1352 RepID=UPI000282619C
MRLDKFLADMGLGSRKEVKGLIKKGTIEVNGQVVKSDKAQVNEFEDAVTYLCINYICLFDYLFI